MSASFSPKAFRFAAGLFCSAFEEKSCSVCGGESFLSPLCRECEQSLYAIASRPPEKTCSVCGAPLLSEDGICTSCRTQRTIFSADKVVSIFPYRAWAREILLEWKLHDERGLSYVFAKAADIAIRGSFANTADLFLTGVPPRVSKMRLRGWDQIAELTGILQRDYGFRTLPLLQRLNDIEQKTLTQEERLLSARQSYAGTPLLARLREGEGLPSHVLLLDDVLTTGATVEACSKILKDAGVKRVDVLTLFTVD